MRFDCHARGSKLLITFVRLGSGGGIRERLLLPVSNFAGGCHPARRHRPRIRITAATIRITAATIRITAATIRITAAIIR
jgi:hypothetical protein